MNNIRLTFYDPVNLSLPIFVYKTIKDDAKYFGFTKNNQPNVNGFLNHLIPCLSNHREDLHKTFLLKNDNDEIFVNKLEKNMYRHYFNQYDYFDDVYRKVSLRITKQKYNEFVFIHDTIIDKYDMDFTEYIRSLLIEYSTQRICKREYFFHYPKINTLKNAIEKSEMCYFYTTERKFAFIPASIELATSISVNLVVGISEDKKTPYFIKLGNIQDIIPKRIYNSLTNEDCDLIATELKKYCDNYKEEVLCLD